MAQLDIPVGPKLQQALDLPSCADFSLPNPKPLVINLPTGGSIQAINDLSRGAPTDCSMSFSLLMQLGPLLASLQCPLKMLKLLQPLVEVITGLAKMPPEPPTPELLKKVTDAVADLVPCFGVLAGAGVPVFILDILKLVRRVLGCLVGQLKTVADLLGVLAVSIADAEEAGNTDLLETLECARKNALTSAGSLTTAVEPLSALLELLAPFFGFAGMDPIVLPGPGSAEDVEALRSTIAVLEDVLDAIDALTGEAA